MKLNEKSLATYASSGAPPDKEGMLLKKGEVNRGYQKRWCVLKGNLFFYYEKRNDKEPLGMIVLEGCTIELSDHTDGFTFMINFPGSGSRTYILSASTQEEMESWMKMLSCASYDYIKTCVAELQLQLSELDSESRKQITRQFVPNSIPSVELKSKPKTTSSRIVRINPFNSGDHSDEENGESRVTTIMEKQARTFSEMFKDYDEQIRAIISEWENEEMLNDKKTSVKSNVNVTDLLS